MLSLLKHITARRLEKTQLIKLISNNEQQNQQRLVVLRNIEQTFLRTAIKLRKKLPNNIYYVANNAITDLENVPNDPQIFAV